MHRPDIITQRVDSIRAEAILHAGIGIVVLESTNDSVILVDANDAFVALSGYEVDALRGKSFGMLHGPRTDTRQSESMEHAARSGEVWKDTIILQDAAGTPLPVTINLMPKQWPDVEGTFAVATITDAAPYTRARNIQRLSHEANIIIERPAPVENQAEGLATAMVRDFADWCTIHLRDPGGTISLAAIASRTGEPAQEQTTLDPESLGIGKVIASGIPLLHQPSHPENSALLTQMQAIIGKPVHAVTSVPVAATTLEAFGAITWAITDDHWEYHHEDIHAAEEIGFKFGHHLEESQIRDSLARAVKARESFMKAAGHELRTPLVSIKGYTQLLLRDFRRQTISPQRLEAGLKAIDTSTSRLTDLMEDMFAISNPGPSSLPLRLVTVDINSYIQEFLTTTPSLGLSGHKFHFSSSHLRIMTHIDVTRFSQVLFNVVINAVHFSPPESDIRLMTTIENGSVIISVSDAGRGLTQGEETLIFDPFTHARSWYESEDQGLGIGLYISKQIVDRHGGQIWAKSDGIDKGTTVFVKLPLTPEHDAGS